MKHSVYRAYLSCYSDSEEQMNKRGKSKVEKQSERKSSLWHNRQLFHTIYYYPTWSWIGGYLCLSINNIICNVYNIIDRLCVPLVLIVALKMRFRHITFSQSKRCVSRHRHRHRLHVCIFFSVSLCLPVFAMCEVAFTSLPNEIWENVCTRCSICIDIAWWIISFSNLYSVSPFFSFSPFVLATIKKKTISYIRSPHGIWLPIQSNPVQSNRGDRESELVISRVCYEIIYVRMRYG